MNIEEFKDIKIAYMRRTGAYGSENKKMMEEFKAYLKENDLLNDNTIILGISLDNPIHVPAEKQRYDIGLIIEEGKKVALNIRKIDDGRYAIFEIPHTERDILSFWNSIQKLTIDLPVDETKPIIERYSTAKIALHLCEFCIPLKQ